MLIQNHVTCTGVVNQKSNGLVFHVRMFTLASIKVESSNHIRIWKIKIIFKSCRNVENRPILNHIGIWQIDYL